MGAVETALRPPRRVSSLRFPDPGRRRAVERRVAIGVTLALALAGRAGEVRAVSGWDVYGGDPGGTRFSRAAQIDRGNVGRLEVAWTYRTGELGDGFATREKLAFEATPILVDGRLYLSTPTDRVIALDPASGRELWRYDPEIDRGRRYAEATSRGVGAWRDPDADPRALARSGSSSARSTAG